jgi:hypothetical protein
VGVGLEHLPALRVPDVPHRPGAVVGDLPRVPVVLVDDAEVGVVIWPKVEAVRRPERRGFDIYVIVGPAPDGGFYYDAGGRIEEVPVGAEGPRFMHVSDGVAEALAEALRPAPEAGARHLDDALNVRDRALGMVERIIDADLAREANRR